MNTKLQQINILKKKGLSLIEIGKKLHPPISGERVRQILKPQKYIKCNKHKILFVKECSYCKIEIEYPKFLNLKNKQGPAWFALEAKRLSKQDRKKETVIQRAIFIKFLKDNQCVPLTAIARLLERDYTSIKNLYLKKI